MKKNLECIYMFVEREGEKNIFSRFFFRFFPLIDYYKILTIIPCVVQ